MVKEFLDLAESKIGSGYVYGSQGETMTQERLNVLIKQQGISHYHLADGTKAEKWIGKQCFDCSGLVLWTLQQLGFVKAGQDYTASMMYSSLCEPITKDKLVPGDLVFIKNTAGSIVHVGIYAGNSKTIEAYGTAKGVVQGDASRFNLYGRMKTFKAEIEKPVDALRDALTFLAKEAGIDYITWYQNAKQVKYLEQCFIKIANAFNNNYN